MDETRRGVLRVAAVPLMPVMPFWGPGVAAVDPAVVAFERVGAAEAAMVDFVGDDWGPAFEALQLAYRDAGRALAATPAGGFPRCRPGWSREAFGNGRPR